MINIKISGVSAGIALVLSFFIGLISGASIFIVLLRAVIFAIVFFALSSAAYIGIMRFIPDMFGQTPEQVPGSHVDISVEEPEQQVAPPVPVVQDEPQPASESQPATEPVEERVAPKKDSSGERLPDLEAMSKTVAPVSDEEGDEEEGEGEEDDESSPRRPLSTNRKPQNLGKDYNPETLAAALRTMLKRD
jgi:hypothetical protein